MSLRGHRFAAGCVLALIVGVSAIGAVSVVANYVLVLKEARR